MKKLNWIIKRSKKDQKKGRKVTKKLLTNRRGQTGTEYMLIIAVVVVGIILGSKVFLRTFEDGVKEMSFGMSSMFKDSKSNLKSLRD